MKRHNKNHGTGRLLEHDGIKLTTLQWATRLRISPNTLYVRLLRGFSVKEALKPTRPFRQKFTFKGRSLPIAGWAKSAGVSKHTFYQRLKHGFNFEQALTHPFHKKRSSTLKIIEFNGQRLSVRGWAKKLGVPENRLSNRFRYGFSVKEALTLPLHKRRKTAAKP